MPSDRMDCPNCGEGLQCVLCGADVLSAAATARPDPHPLIAYIRGLCSDEEPYELIDAKLAELDESVTGPDWEGIVRELYEAAESVIDRIRNEPGTISLTGVDVALSTSMMRYQRASLGEGEGGR